VIVLDNINKIQEEIEKLQNEIDAQMTYFNEKLKTPLMEASVGMSDKAFFVHYIKAFKYNRVKVIFSRYKVKVGKYGKRSKIMKKVEIRYKHRKVLEFEYRGEGVDFDLKKFHACEWLQDFDSLMERVSEGILEDEKKEELKLLKARRKIVKRQCVSISPLCKEDGDEIIERD